MAGNLSPKLDWPLANPKWAATINPVLSLPILNGTQIDAVNLAGGQARAINHLLQRMPQGWFLVDQNTDAIVWRAAAFNNLTLSLQADADVTVSIWVY